MVVNRPILGDNLEILKTIDENSVDLYLYPSFFGNRNYEVIWGDTGEIRSFQDRWSGGISHYKDKGFKPSIIIDKDGRHITTGLLMSHMP